MKNFFQRKFISHQKFDIEIVLKISMCLKIHLSIYVVELYQAEKRLLTIINTIEVSRQHLDWPIWPRRRYIHFVSGDQTATACAAVADNILYTPRCQHFVTKNENCFILALYSHLLLQMNFLNIKKAKETTESMSKYVAVGSSAGRDIAVRSDVDW